MIVQTVLGQPGCRWFVLCDQPSIGTVDHPTLGPVEICQHHVDWLADQAGGGPKWVPPIIARRLDLLGEGHPMRLQAGLDRHLAQDDA